MESENLLEYVSIERTWFYKQGVKAAEAKHEKWLEQQEEQRLKMEEQRLKMEEQRLKEKELFVAALLLNSSMKKDRIALLASSKLELVESTENKIYKTQKLLEAQVLTIEEIATAIKVSNDFVKLVVEKNNE